MAPTQDLIPRFGIFKSIFNVCISFSGGRDSLVRIPALTHERPRIINLTHGSKDRAWVLAGGERLQRFYSLFTHSGQVSRVCGTNFSALILGGSTRGWYSPTGGAVFVEGVEVAIRDQLATIHSRLDCAKASKHSHLQLHAFSHSP